MKKTAMKLLAGFAGLMLLCMNATTALAAESPMVVEKYTTETGVVLYVNGIDSSVNEISYQIGTETCTIDSIMTVKESDETINTLILWDNSLSVMNKRGSDIQSILIDTVANRAPGEVFAIATIDDGITYLSDYTDDYASLKQIIEGVSGEDKDAYIIENLYNAIESFNNMNDCGYKRIILISDGVDAMEIGYSRSELDALIAKTPYPIYTIGAKNSNEEEVQDMFSLSRATGVNYFYLEEIEDPLTVVQGLSADYSMWQIKVTVPGEMRDGSSKNSKLSLISGSATVSIETEVKLPFLAEGEDTGDGADVSGNEVDLSGMVADATVAGEESVNNVILFGMELPKMLVIGVAAGVVLLIIIIVVLIVVSKKKKQAKENPDNSYQMLDQKLRNERNSANGGVGAAPQTPNLQTPNVHAPNVPVPNVQTPNIQAPNMPKPNVPTPNFQAQSPVISPVGNPAMNSAVTAGFGSAAVQSAMAPQSAATPQNAAPMAGKSAGTQLLFDGPVVPAMSTAPVQHRVVLTNVKDSVQTYQCGLKDKIIIGRNPIGCNIAITTDNAVSEKHCEIGISGEKFYIKDLGSSNGTMVNNFKISTATEVKTGCVLKLGREEYRLIVE